MEPFWEPGDDFASPATAEAVAEWESVHRVQLPVRLSRPLLVQNGGLVRGAALDIEPLERFTALDDQQWHDVWADGPPAAADRARQIYIGESAGVGVVLDYVDNPAPRVLLLHHGQGRELRDHGFATIEDFLQSTCFDCGP